MSKMAVCIGGGLATTASGFQFEQQHLGGVLCTTTLLNAWLDEARPLLAALEREELEDHDRALEERALHRRALDAALALRPATRAHLRRLLGHLDHRLCAAGDDLGIRILRRRSDHDRSRLRILREALQAAVDQAEEAAAADTVVDFEAVGEAEALLAAAADTVRDFEEAANAEGGGDFEFQAAN